MGLPMKQQTTKELKVTPEMIEAGWRAWLKWSAEAFPYEEGYEDRLPERIYRAMEEARRSR